MKQVLSLSQQSYQTAFQLSPQAMKIFIGGNFTLLTLTVGGDSNTNVVTISIKTCGYGA